MCLALRNRLHLITNCLTDGWIHFISCWNQRTESEYRSRPRPAEAGQAGVSCLIDERRHNLLRHVCEDGECRDDDKVDESCIQRKVLSAERFVLMTEKESFPLRLWQNYIYSFSWTRFSVHAAHRFETEPPWWTCGHTVVRRATPALPLYHPKHKWKTGNKNVIN